MSTDNAKHPTNGQVDLKSVVNYFFTCHWNAVQSYVGIQAVW